MSLLQSWLCFRACPSFRLSCPLFLALSLSCLVLDRQHVDSVFYPVFPGLQLTGALFQGPAPSYHGIRCPGQGCFSDLVSWTNGPTARFALVATSNADPRVVDPVSMGINAITAADWFLHRVYPLAVPQTGIRALPPLTWLVGDFDLPALASYARQVRNIAPAPTLGNKLGGRLAAFAKAPLIKVDSGVMQMPFGNYNSVFDVSWY